MNRKERLRWYKKEFEDISEVIHNKEELSYSDFLRIRNFKLQNSTIEDEKNIKEVTHKAFKLAERDKINTELQKVIDKQSDPWGIKVSLVEVKHIDLPLEMKRAMAKQAEAERESRAIQIKANAELQASYKLQEAAANMTDPNAMQLRVLSTINDVSKDQSNTIILALPLETLRAASVDGIAAMASIQQKEYTKTQD